MPPPPTLLSVLCTGWLVCLAGIQLIHAKEVLLSGLPANVFDGYNATVNTHRLTCVAQSGNSSSRIQWLQSTDAAGSGNVNYAEIPQALVNETEVNTGVDHVLISILLMRLARVRDMGITHIQCRLNNDPNQTSTSLIVQVLVASCEVATCAPTRCSCPSPRATVSMASASTPTTASTTTTVPLIGDPVVFWAIVAVGGFAWLLLLFITVITRAGKKKEAQPQSRSRPNNQRAPDHVRREEQRRRRESGEIRSREVQARALILSDANDNGAIFSNPLFESDSLRHQSQQQQLQHQQSQPSVARRPPLPLPSEMNEPATAWPGHSQSQLTSSASNLHLSMANLHPYPSPSQQQPPRPSPMDGRPPAALPHSTSDIINPSSLPRSISSEPNLNRGVVSSSGLTRPPLVPVGQPPAIPTTQRPTLPRPTRSSHDLCNGTGDQGPPTLPHTVPKRDSAHSPMPQGPYSTLTSSGSFTGVYEQPGTVEEDYLEPTTGPGDIPAWSHQYPAPTPAEYLIVAENDTVDNAINGQPYMDMVGIERTQPQIGVYGDMGPSPSAADQAQLIAAKKVNIPRRLHRPSSPTGAPQFRKSKHGR